MNERRGAGIGLDQVCRCLVCAVGEVNPGEGRSGVDAIKFTHDFGQRMKAPSQGSLVNAATEFDDASQAKLVKTARIN